MFLATGTTAGFLVTGSGKSDLREREAAERAGSRFFGGLGFKLNTALFVSIASVLGVLLTIAGFTGVWLAMRTGQELKRRDS